jgi:hypothetical protein
MAKFEVLDVFGPDWPSLPTVRRQALLSAFQAPGWLRDSANRRFGFRQFNQEMPEIFAGYFAIESRLRYFTYDETGAPPLEDVVTEFERVLAIFLALEGRWVLHERRFFRTDVNKAIVRDRFQEAVRLAQSNAGIAGLPRIEPFEQALSDVEMLDRFIQEPNRVIRIDVRELHGRSVPNAYRFFNPRYDLDQEVHTLVNHDLTVIQGAEFEAADSADIRHAKVPQALARAGAVEEFATQDSLGRRRRIRRSIPPTFELQIDLDDPAAPLTPIVQAVVAAVTEAYPSRYGGQDNYVGGLFEGLGAPDDE